MRKFFNRLLASTFARNAGIITVGTMLAQAIGLAVMPILSRIFTPTDFGLLALFVAVATVTSTIVPLSYPIRILLPEDDNEADAISQLSIFSSLGLGLALGILAYLLSDGWAEKLGLLSVKAWLPAAIWAGTATALIGILSFRMNRHQQYTRMVMMRIVQAIFVAGSGLLLGFWAVNHGLLLAQLIGLSVTVILFAGVLFFGTKWVGLARLREVASIHAKAPRYLLPTALLDVFTMQLPYVLIALWFAAETTGQYRMAYSILALPGALVGSAISQVFYKQFSVIWPDAKAAKALLIKTWKVLALLGLLPLIVVMLFGAELFSFVLGDAWREAGLMASILAPMVFVSLIHSPTSVSFLPMGLESKMLYFGVSVLLYRPMALYIGYIQHNIYIGLAVFVVLEILQMLMFQYIAWQQLNFHINKGKQI